MSIKIRELSKEHMVLCLECGELNTQIDNILADLNLEELERILPIYKAKLIDTRATLEMEREWGPVWGPTDPVGS